MSLTRSQPSLPEALPVSRNRSGPITYDEYQGLDHGRGVRFELIDGQVVVTPSPFAPHQRVVTNLIVLLHGAVERDLEVFTAPFSWYVDEHNAFQPDVMVVRRTEVERRHLHAPPAIGVEVLSSNRSYDLVFKRDVYARAGLPEYWIVDEEVPSLLVLRNDGAGGFAEVAHVRGAEVYESDVPFPVRVVPAALQE